jgi:hypothetical protein
MVYAYLFTMRKHSVENHTPLRNAVPFSFSVDLFVPVYVADSTTLSCVFREDIDYIVFWNRPPSNGSQLTQLINRFAIQTSLFPTRKWSVALRFPIIFGKEVRPVSHSVMKKLRSWCLVSPCLYRVLVRKSWKYSFSATKSSRMVRLIPETLFQPSLTA